MQDHHAGRSRAGQLPDRLRAVGPGWHPLLLRLHSQLLAWDVDYRVEVLKEKFGAVRVYIATDTGASDSEMRDLVLPVEEQSATVCEFCGAAGRRRRRGDAPHGWIKAVCDPCHTAWSRHTIMIVNGTVHHRRK
ncbi:hypothetical protein [Streptomyces murinus]|uniref:hypothetical protein n=1 Tax=Streptomyces murinus TaxID=33900 RepID=UPI0038229F69